MGVFLLQRNPVPDLEKSKETTDEPRGALLTNGGAPLPPPIDSTDPNKAPIQSLAAYDEYNNALGFGVGKGVTTFEDRVRRDYRWHTVQYWFVATLANGLLWVQIIVGAALTACGASSGTGAKTATIYLGATSTVIAGLLTYFKSRNQPNRSRQLRNALKNVRNKMDEALPAMKAAPNSQAGRAKADEIIQMYDKALADAQANYPDLWISLFTQKNDQSQGKSGKKAQAEVDEQNPKTDSENEAGTALGTDHKDPASVPLPKDGIKNDRDSNSSEKPSITEKDPHILDLGSNPKDHTIPVDAVPNRNTLDTDPR